MAIVHFGQCRSSSLRTRVRFILHVCSGVGTRSSKALALAARFTTPLRNLLLVAFALVQLLRALLFAVLALFILAALGGAGEGKRVELGKGSARADVVVGRAQVLALVGYAQPAADALLALDLDARVEHARAVDELVAGTLGGRRRRRGRGGRRRLLWGGRGRGRSGAAGGRNRFGRQMLKRK